MQHRHLLWCDTNFECVSICHTYMHSGVVKFLCRVCQYPNLSLKGCPWNYACPTLHHCKLCLRSHQISVLRSCIADVTSPHISLHSGRLGATEDWPHLPVHCQQTFTVEFGGQLWIWHHFEIIGEQRCILCEDIDARCTAACHHYMVMWSIPHTYLRYICLYVTMTTLKIGLDVNIPRFVIHIHMLGKFRS